MTDKDKINDTDFEVDADDLEYIDYNFPEIDFSNGGYTINLWFVQFKYVSHNTWWWYNGKP